MNVLKAMNAAHTAQSPFPEWSVSDTAHGTPTASKLVFSKLVFSKFIFSKLVIGRPHPADGLIMQHVQKPAPPHVSRISRSSPFQCRPCLFRLNGQRLLHRHLFQNLTRKHRKRQAENSEPQREVCNTALEKNRVADIIHF